MEIPGGVGEVSVTIDYTYDPLYRLTDADYSTGEYFWYMYDAVGNRLAQETHEETNTYVFDTANRLIEVDGVTYVWDDNGNLIHDDARFYGYDYANRLTFVLMDGDTYNFSYNGLGDRLTQSVNGIPTNYSLDINRGLTQVISDGVNTYLYGVRRIGEEQTGGWQYHLGDALGSVRQLVDVTSSGVGAGMAYEPFGDELVSIGVANSVYGFTGEWDGTELVHLRARYYAPSQGRFLSRDVWPGDYARPVSLNQWIYALGNPINFSDPSGRVYQRAKAVHAALAHDLMAPFPVRGYNWREIGTDCASFASYVLWEGGIRDWRPEPWKIDQKGGRSYKDYPIPYWNGDWAESDTPMFTYAPLNFF